jgi:uncharacterized protein (TIGR00730 family)
VDLRQSLTAAARRARRELTGLVGTMHARKALMADLSHAFIAMPGGIGTLDEFFEILTWHTLRIHQKPIGLWNVSGFFDPLLAMLDHCVREGFLSQAARELIVVPRAQARDGGARLEQWLQRFVPCSSDALVASRVGVPLIFE